jgi:sugar phosphate isomerase/epimerase
MKIGGATYCKNDIEIELKNIKSNGFDFAELDLGFPVEPCEEFKERIKDCRNIVPILVGHLPEIDFKTDEIERCKKFIEILSEINCCTFVIHLFSRNLTTEDNLSQKIKGLMELAAYADERNSVIVLENTEEDINILERVFSKVTNICFCLDIGHANLFSKENRSSEFIEVFQKKLKHVHFHDNIGGNSESSDLHLPIGRGKIDYLIIRKLGEVGYSGNLTLEINCQKNEEKQLSVVFLRKLLKLHH